MKKIIQRVLLLLVVMWSSPQLFAAGTQPFEVDGIRYEVIGNQEVGVASAKYEGDIELPEKVTYEGKEYAVTKIMSAFQNCSELTSVSIPNSVKEITAQSFLGCAKLTKIVVPNSVEEMGDFMFMNCKSLSSVVLPNSLPHLNVGMFYGCENLESIDIPETVEYILTDAFRDCSKLTSITIPKSVKSITTAVFAGCTALKSIILFSSLEFIGKYAFYKCPLELIINKDPLPCDFDPDTFDETTYSDATLIVPDKEAISTYEESYNWGKFKKITTETVYIDRSELLFPGIGMSFKLTASVNPNILPQSIKWTTSDSNVATVSTDGKVTSVSAGYATITATSEGGKTATCEITVVDVKIKPESITGEVGETFQLEAIIEPENYPEDRVYIKWGIGDTYIADVDKDGKVTLKNEGETYVYCSLNDGYRATCNVTVAKPEEPMTITKFEMTETKIAGYIGDGVKLVVDVVTDPAEAVEGLTIEWISSDPAVAGVDKSGYVSFNGSGRATITASAGDKTATCEVTVTEKPTFVPVTSLTLSANDVELPLNYTYSLFVFLTPADATGTDLEWITSNPAVARVYEGVVVGIVPGEAVITAKTTDGTNLSASCHFTIVDPSGIDDVESGAIKVTGGNGMITIAGASVGDIVEVYTLAGVSVIVKNIESTVEELPMPVKGIYVVRIDNKVFKVAL